MCACVHVCTDGLAPHSDPCSSDKGVHNHAAYKNGSLVNFFTHSPKQELLVGASLHKEALGSFSDCSAQLLATTETMNEKRIEILALSGTRWSGHGITKSALPPSFTVAPPMVYMVWPFH